MLEAPGWLPQGWWWIGVPILALDLLAIGRALIRGHGVESTLAWILAVIAFPGVGAVVYLLVANPRIARTVRRKREAVSAPIAAGETTEPSCAAAGLLRLAANVSGLGVTRSNAVELLAEDEHAFERIEEALEGAEASIWAEYYIVRNDETGHRFLELLARAATRGLDVRLIHDAVGSLGLDRDRLRAIRAAGGRAEPFLPLNPLRKRWSVHLRNHRKLVVIDGRVAFTGGMNVGDEYSGRSRRRGAQFFRDTHLSLRGPAVQDLAQVFADDWHFSTGEPITALPAIAPAAPGNARIAVVPSGPDQEENASALAYFAGITLAQRTCYLTTPYFFPDQPTLRALVATARRGVDVRLLLPAKSDVALIAPAARAAYPALVRAGVRIFEYLPSMLHAKSLVVDGAVAIVGSANLDFRSFRFNFEVGAALEDPSLATLLETRFLAELAQSREIGVKEIEATPLATRMGRGVARLVSPLL